MFEHGINCDASKEIQLEEFELGIFLLPFLVLVLSVAVMFFFTYMCIYSRYKKNLKALYVVHPTNFIRILWNLFKPLIRQTHIILSIRLFYLHSVVFTFLYLLSLSHKFGKKLTYVNYLAELREHVNYEQLIIPHAVLRSDAKC